LDIQDDLGRHEGKKTKRETISINSFKKLWLLKLWQVGFIDDTAKYDINNGAGCRMRVLFRINKVPGNFHVSTHASHEQPEHPNMA